MLKLATRELIATKKKSDSNDGFSSFFSKQEMQVSSMPDEILEESQGSGSSISFKAQPTIEVTVEE